MASNFGKNTLIKVIGGNVEFRFESRDVTQFSRALDFYRAQVKDFTEVFEDFGPYMLRSIDRNFQAQGRPRKWQPLAPATVKERQRQGFGDGPILIRTGGLKQGFRFDYGKQSFRIYNTKFYYPYHQEGRGFNPKRPMVALNDEDKARFTRLSRDHMRMRG